MFKRIVLLLALVGCSVPSAKEGEVCQAKRGWKDLPTCQMNHDNVPCMKVVEGPVVIQQLETSGACPSRMMASIKDTWATDGTTRWSVKAPRYVQMVLKDIKVNAGESLFLGTDTANDKEDSSCCYVNWKLKN